MRAQGLLINYCRASVYLSFLLCSALAPTGHGRRLLTGPSTVQLTANATSFRDGDIVQVRQLLILHHFKVHAQAKHHLCKDVNLDGGMQNFHIEWLASCSTLSIADSRRLHGQECSMRPQLMQLQCILLETI